MAPFTNLPRHLWGRGHASPTPSASDSITNFDRLSDGEIRNQQMHLLTPRQQLNSSPAIRNGFVHSATKQLQAAHDEHQSQPFNLQQYGQPFLRSATYQAGNKQNWTRILKRQMQELRNGGHDQYNDPIRQLLSPTAAAQPPDTSSQHVLVSRHVPDFQSPGTTDNASAEAQIKEEPAPEDTDDHDLFAEFTNNDVHDMDDQGATSHQKGAEKAIDLTLRASCEVPSIKQKTRIGEKSPIDILKQAEILDLVVTGAHVTAGVPGAITTQATGMPTQNIAGPAFETSIDTSRMLFATTHPRDEAARNLISQENTSTPQPLNTFAPDLSQSASPSEQQQQTSAHHRVEANNDKSQRSPSVDSVIGSQRHSSEDTAISMAGMNLTARTRQLEQEWKDRYKLSGMGTLTAQAVQANPSLLHGPTTSQQYGQNATQPASGTFDRQHMVGYPSNAPIVNLTPSMHGAQRNSKFPYAMNMQYLTYPTSTQHSQFHRLMPPGYASNPSMQRAPRSNNQPTQAYLPQGSISPQCISDERDEERFEASDDDEPLVTRAPRRRSATVEPTVSSTARQQADSGTKAESTEAAPKASASGVKIDSAIEISDNDNAEKIESISWKLPDYVATYHPPATDKDLPEARISIPNLPREPVALTEDHAQQEMQLYLDVFLPAQRALQTPDPEPAYAVINFHTISVMVLEAFAHYEVGDELGHGYGFAGGHSARRPSPSSSSDGELPRTRSAKDADVDEIFFAVIDRWRAGLASGKETMKLIRGCQEFCDIALDVIHYVKEHGLLQPELRKRKERSDKGVARGPRGGAKGAQSGVKGSQGGVKEVAAKPKTTGVKRKADAVESEAPGKKGANVGKATTVQPRKKAKVEEKKKPKAKTKSAGVMVTPRKK